MTVSLASHPVKNLTPHDIEQLLSDASLFAARLQLFVCSALVWLIFIFGAMANAVPPLIPTLLLCGWLVVATVALNHLARHGGVEFLTGPLPGRLALLGTILTVVLAALLARDAGGDFFMVYFFPVAVAATYYGWRGGIACAALGALTYVLLALSLTGVATGALLSFLAWRVLFLFALGGAVGIAAQGQVALVGELQAAYANLERTVQALQAARAALARRVDEAGTLAAVGRALTSTLDPEAVLRMVLEQVESLLDAEAVTLMRLDPATNELVFEIPLGRRADRLRGYRLPVGRGIAGWVAQTGAPVRVDEAALDRRHFAQVDRESGFHTTSILCVPLSCRERVTGVIEVMNKRSGTFTAEDENLLTAIGQWAAIALENARLYRDLQESVKELERAQERLLRTERVRALGELANGVAHDFNNLLTIILTEAQLLSARLAGQDESGSAERIERAGREAAQVVRRMQDYAGVQREAPTEIVELDELVYEAVEMTRPRWRSVATLDLRVEPVGAVIGHPAGLREVLTNLVFNALEARVDRRDCRLTLATRREAARWAVVTVEDNGCGIPPDALAHIFEPYYTTKLHGTGLGLSIAQGIVQRHGGEIRVTSPILQSGQGSGGTRFEIYLPLASRAERPAPLAAHPASG